jgi:hypothetical protein
MRCFAWLRVGGALLLALLSAAFISSGSASAAQPSAQRGSPAACAGKLNGYAPDAEQYYLGIIGLNQQLGLDDVKETGDGRISGSADYWVSGFDYPGTFTGTVRSATFDVKGAITGYWGFSFSGDATCLLSQFRTTDFTTDPGESPFNSAVTFTSDCQAVKLTNGEQVACEARQILDGIPQLQWHNGAPILDDGDIPYSYGGGHPHLGPTTGTCVGYTGPHSNSKKSPKACQDWKYGPTHTIGLDCTGFTRWVFYLTFGKDVLGSGGTNDPQSQRTRPGVHEDKGKTPSIGDLVYFKSKSGAWHHVGILIAPGVVIDEPQTGDLLSVDRITRSGFGTPYYYAYDFKVQ